MDEENLIAVCPRPIHWAKIHQRFRKLAKLKRLPQPPIPLILAGWHFTSDAEKQERWNETVEWAKENGLIDELSWLSIDEMYRVEWVSHSVPYDNYTYGGHEPRPKLSREDRKRICEELRSNWSTIVGEPLASNTVPVRLTGRKGRRLVVRANEAYKPSWGSWWSTSEDRAAFAAFRASINARIAPSQVDHVDFVFPNPEGKD